MRTIVAIILGATVSNLAACGDDVPARLDAGGDAVVATEGLAVIGCPCVSGHCWSKFSWSFDTANLAPQFRLFTDIYVDGSYQGRATSDGKGTVTGTCAAGPHGLQVFKYHKTSAMGNSCDLSLEYHRTASNPGDVTYSSFEDGSDRCTYQGNLYDTFHEDYYMGPTILSLPVQFTGNGMAENQTLFGPHAEAPPFSGTIENGNYATGK